MRSLIVIGLLCLPGWLAAQVAEVRLYGASGDDEFVEIRETETGYLVAGTTASSLNADTDFYLLALNEDLTLNWTQTYGAGGVDLCTGMDTTATGDVLLCGFTNDTPAGDYDVSVVRAAPDGTPIWEQHYGGTDWDLDADILAMPEGGFVLLFTTYTPLGDTDVVLLKANDDGDVVWEITLGDTFNQTAACLTLGVSGEILAGATWASSADSSSRRAWLGSFDADGTLQQEGFYGNTETELFEVVNHQDAFAGVGYSINAEGERDHIVFKNEPDFTLDWIREDGDPGDDVFQAMASTDLGMVVVGKGNEYGAGGYGALTQQRTHSGWWVQSSHFGGTLDEEARDVIVDAQGRTVIVGSSDSYSAVGDRDGYLIRLEGIEVFSEFTLDELDVEDGSLGLPDLAELGILEATLPGGDRLLTDPNGRPLTAEVYTLNGQLLTTEKGVGQLRIHLQAWPAGIYLVRVHTEYGTAARLWTR